ncbi:MAG: polysaccharide deacetylase family protein [Bacilli bacterium]
MKKKIIIIIPLVVILAILLYFCSIRLKGKNEIILSITKKYKEPGYTSLLKVKTTNNIKNKIGTYQVIYKNLIFKKKRTVKIIDDVKPTITLIGENIELAIGENFIDPGVIVKDNIDKNLKYTTKTNLQITKEGSYKIVYTTKDKSGNLGVVSRVINVIDKLYKESYEASDNKRQGWYTSNRQDGVRPRATEIDTYKALNVVYLGEDSKKVYLTFDEGGGNVTYVNEIVDILDKYNIKATFFFCKNYIINNKDLMLKIQKGGHGIGNHTVRHLSMPSLSTKEKYDTYYQEIKETEQAFFQTTGKPMEKLFRYPMGEFSNRTMNIMNTLGYRSVFWSVAYVDWDKEYSKEYALNNMKKQLHNGAVYLIHPKAKCNYEALEEFIIYLKDNGYTFGLAKEI